MKCAMTAWRRHSLGGRRRLPGLGGTPFVLSSRIASTGGRTHAARSTISRRRQSQSSSPGGCAVMEIRRSASDPRQTTAVSASEGRSRHRNHRVRAKSRDTCDHEHRFELPCAALGSAGAPSLTLQCRDRSGTRSASLSRPPQRVLRTKRPLAPTLGRRRPGVRCMWKALDSADIRGRHARLDARSRANSK